MNTSKQQYETVSVKKPDWYRRFGIWCSGASTEVLYQYPTEWNKFAISGYIILMTAVLSFVSGSYFLSFVFDEQDWKIPVVFGVIWAILIFTLDRSIIVSIKKTDVFGEEFRQGSIRIVLAIFIGLVIATPIELRLFKEEINRNVSKTLNDEKIKELIKNKNDNEEQLLKINNEISELNSTDSTLRKDKDTKYTAHIEEAEGTSGTRKVGKGPVYKEKEDAYRKAYDDWEKNYNKLSEKRSARDSINLKIINIDGQIAIIRNGTNTGNIQKFGVEDQVKELYKLSGLHWFITLLFILIECLPVITKLMNKRGSYDETLERIEYENMIEQKKLISRTNSKINESLKQAEEVVKLWGRLSLQIQKDKLDAELQNNREILDDIAKKQLKLATLAIDKWYQEELEKMKTSSASAYTTTKTTN